MNILEEYAKCLSDISYYGERYCQVDDKTQGGIVPLQLFTKQKELMTHYAKNRFSIVLKPRQAGVSTVTALFAAHKILFSTKNTPVKILIVANKLATANEFIKKIRGYIDSRPSWLNVAYSVITNNKSEFEIVDAEGNFIGGAKATATSEDAMRGYSPTLLIMDEAAFITNGAELWGSAGASLSTGGGAIFISCVTKDTFVFTDKGIRQVNDFINYSEPDNPLIGYNIDEYSIRGNDKLRKSNIFVNDGIQNTIKINTTSSQLEGTLKHKLWAFSRKNNNFNWYELKDLEIGDSINVQYGFNLWGSDDIINHNYKFSNYENKPKKIYNKIDSNLAYLIGLYISEGSSYKPKYKNNVVGCDITITCGDDISKYIINAGFNYSCTDGLHYKISSKYLGSLLENLGFDLNLKAPNKYIPNKLLSMSKDNIIAMIQGIMDGDGYSDIVRGRIGLSMSSEKLVSQMKALFLNMGILTDFQTGFTPITKKVKVTSEYFRISAIGDDAQKYYDEIGFRFKRKQDKKSSLKLNNGKSKKLIPNGKVIIKKIISDNNLNRKLRNTGLKINDLRVKSNTSDLNIDTFRNFITYFNKINIDLNEYELDKILFNNSKWEKINKITCGKNETFDFSLPNDDKDFWCHSIIYNGILGHQTPNGLDALYYKTYQGALEKKNNFKIFEMQWWQDPRFNKDLTFEKVSKVEGQVDLHVDVQQAKKDNHNKWVVDDIKRLIKGGYKPTSSWFRGMCELYSGDERLIAQELLGDFLGSGDNVFGDEYIKQQERNVELPIDTGFFDNNLHIWEHPQPNAQYLLASDVSRGDSADSSSIEIFNMDTGEQAAEWHGKVPPDKLGIMINEIGLKYQALAIVDITGGMGQATVIKLCDLKYPWIYYSDASRNNVLKSQMNKYKKNNDQIPGFIIGTNRILAIQALEIAIRTGQITIKSKRLIGELKTYVWINGKPDHMRGYHDDMLIAVAMLLFVFQYSFKNLKRYDAQTVAMLNAWGVSATTRPNLSSGPIEDVNDLSWLYK